MSRMYTLTKNLEVSLGPDTGELGLRIGLHSGQVTAGVLRGERARFQVNAVVAWYILGRLSYFSFTCLHSFSFSEMLSILLV
jgi:hypothetical protein